MGNQPHHRNQLGTLWSDDKFLVKTVKLYEDGLSINEIAERLGVSKNAIGGKLARLIKAGEIKGRGAAVVRKPRRIEEAPPPAPPAKPKAIGKGRTLPTLPSLVGFVEE